MLKQNAFCLTFKVDLEKLDMPLYNQDMTISTGLKSLANQISSADATLIACAGMEPV